MEYQGIEYLRRKLARHQERVNIRYRYYEMKNAVRDFNIVIPKEWSFLTATLGWCTKAVDSLADRIVFREFANDNFDINSIFRMNSKDVFVDSAILSACIASCCFVYISADEDGYPRLQVIDGYDATGIIDTPTMLLEEGYAVLERDPKRTGRRWRHGSRKRRRFSTICWRRQPEAFRTRPHIRCWFRSSTGRTPGDRSDTAGSAGRA